MKNPFCGQEFWDNLSDDLFLEQIEGAITLGEALAQLNVYLNPIHRTNFMERVAKLSVDISHYPNMPLDMVPALRMSAGIKRSNSYSSLATFLNLPASKKKLMALRIFAEEEGYDTSHFKVRWSEVTEEDMLEAFKHHSTATSIAVYLRCATKGKVGGTTLTGYYRRLETLGLEPPIIASEAPLVDMKSSVKIRAWLLRERGHACEDCGRDSFDEASYIPIAVRYVDGNLKNKTEDNLQLVCGNCLDQKKDRGRRIKEMSDEGKGTSKFLEEFSGMLHRTLSLIAERGFHCEGCLREEWEGDYLPINLHHKDRDRYNNTPHNLQLLCVNCHYIEHDKCNTLEAQKTKNEIYQARLQAEAKKKADTKRSEEYRRQSKQKRQSFERNQTIRRGRGLELLPAINPKSLKKLQTHDGPLHPSGFFTDPDDY